MLDHSVRLLASFCYRQSERVVQRYILQANATKLHSKRKLPTVAWSSTEIRFPTSSIECLSYSREFLWQEGAREQLGELTEELLSNNDDSDIADDEPSISKMCAVATVMAACPNKQPHFDLSFGGCGGSRGRVSIHQS